MKKKLVALLLMTTLAFGLVACGGSDAPANNDVDDEIEEDVEDEDEDEEDDDEDEEVVVPESEGTLVFDAPEGFIYDEALQLYTSPNFYEYVNINYYYIPNDGSFAMVTEDMMIDSLETGLSQTYRDEIDIEMTEWKSIEVDGYEAIRFSYAYEYESAGVVQTQIIVNGTDNYHYLILTNCGTENYADTFNAVIDSMRFE